MRFVLAVLGFAICTSSAEAHRPERPCYDIVVIGTLEDAANVVDLNELSPPGAEGEFYLGFRADVRLRVLDSDVDGLEGRTISVRAFFTDMPQGGARLRMFLRPVKPALDWYRGVFWDWQRSLEYDGPIPRCAAPPAPSPAFSSIVQHQSL